MVINLGLQHLMDDMDDSDDTLSEGEESITNGIVGYLVIIIIVVILKEIHLCSYRKTGMMKQVRSLLASSFCLSVCLSLFCFALTHTYYL